MDRATLIAWIVAAAFAVAALVAVIAQVTHWKRTLAVTLVGAVVAAAYALTRKPRASA